MVSPFTAEAFAPLGVPIGWLVVAGVVLVAVVVLIVVALRRRRRRRIAAETTAALTAPAPEPVVPREPPSAVGESAAAVADAAAPAEDAAPQEPEQAEPPQTAPEKADVAPSVATVGDLAALRGGRPLVASEVREPDMTPLPVSSDMLLQRAAARRASTSVRVRVPDRAAAATATAEEPAEETNVAAPWLRVDLTLADDTTPGPEAGQPTTGDATASAGDGPGAGAPGAGLQEPDDEPDDAPRPVAARQETPTGAVLRAVPPPADESAGAGRTLADAVANALANRAAADRTRSQQPVEAPDSDARDRLLAVLLEDPDRAVGATVELDRVRGQLDRLVEAVRHEQDALAGLVDKLASAGLDDAQIARLAGIPAGEVATLRAAEG